MIKITKIENNKVYYECSCGVKGKCIVKPLLDNSERVINITCPSCLTTENITLNNNECSDEDTFYSLALVIENKVIEKE